MQTPFRQNTAIDYEDTTIMTILPQKVNTGQRPGKDFTVFLHRARTPERLFIPRLLWYYEKKKRLKSMEKAI